MVRAIRIRLRVKCLCVHTQFTYRTEFHDKEEYVTAALVQMMIIERTSIIFYQLARGTGGLNST